VTFLFIFLFLLVAAKEQEKWNITGIGTKGYLIP